MTAPAASVLHWAWIQCARAHYGAGVCDTGAATLTIAAGHLRAVHGIPRPARDQRLTEYRNALGESGFRDATQSAEQPTSVLTPARRSIPR
ncbi:hypothetical protein ACQPZ2_25710 [Nocardia pseudovaccinii]|uniref:hypothetical protein n=1 Tax=Nocardia pseudovaccinii TaxID=189540 RepID=UPI003D8F9082